MTNISFESYFNNYLSQSKKLALFYEQISAKGDLVTYGGLVRAFLEKRNIDKIRDIDLIINTTYGSQYWENCFKQYDYRINSFGGFKITIDSFIIDFWELNDTWAFRKQLIEPKIENLEKTVFLNIDAAVYEFSSHKFYKEIYEQAISIKCLDIVLESNPIIMINFIRALNFSKTYDMQFSDHLKNTFRNSFCQITPELINQLLNAQLKHYGSEVNSEQEIKNCLEIVFMKNNF